MKNTEIFLTSKFDHPDTDVFFWGCPHIGHNPTSWDIPLWKLRGYTSSIEHDDELTKNAQSVLTENSILFLLGDNAFTHRAEELLLNFLRAIPFSVCYMMPGNHTAGYKSLLFNHSQNLEMLINGHKVVKFIPNYFEAKFNDFPVVMCHYPILSWNGMAKGSIMLYSHVHGSLSNSLIGQMYEKHYRCKEVSVEKTKYPLSLFDIKKELTKVHASTPDHHDKHVKNPF
jgi:calcineurin-like phosphoesterase family protein